MIKKEYKKRTPIEKLEKHRFIDKKTGCWIWTGRIDNSGYGRILIKTNNGKQKVFNVHRYSFSAYNNVELTTFDIICHQCHNRKCFNPAHLIKSTQLNNSIEKLRDWDEFQFENKEIVDKYLSIKEDVKKAYYNWHRKL